MKSKIVKVKSFHNYLTNHLPAITEFRFFMGHPNVHITGHAVFRMGVCATFYQGLYVNVT